MSCDPFNFVKGLFVGVGITTVIWLLAVASMIETHHIEAIQHGAGSYNERTGVFEWKEIVKEDGK